MTRRKRATAGGESLSRAFYDIAQVLESAENSEERVVLVLERLRSLVPYEHCAVLEALPGREPRLITVPATPPEERHPVLTFAGRPLSLPIHGRAGSGRKMDHSLLSKLPLHSVG